MPQKSPSDHPPQRRRVGDTDVTFEIDNQFRQKLIRVAHKHLTPQILPKEGSEAVVQSAFKSFYDRYSEKQYDPEECWKLLAAITKNKCAERVEYFKAGKRNPKREISLRRCADGSAQSEGSCDIKDTASSPSEVVVCTDTLEYVMGTLQHTRDRAILLCFLERKNLKETAAIWGCSEGTVRRRRMAIFEILRPILKRLLGDSQAEP